MESWVHGLRMTRVWQSGYAGVLHATGRAEMVWGMARSTSGSVCLGRSGPVMLERRRMRDDWSSGPIAGG